MRRRSSVSDAVLPVTTRTDPPGIEWRGRSGSQLTPVSPGVSRTPSPSTSRPGRRLRFSNSVRTVAGPVRTSAGDVAGAMDAVLARYQIAVVDVLWRFRRGAASRWLSAFALLPLRGGSRGAEIDVRTLERRLPFAARATSSQVVDAFTARSAARTRGGCAVQRRPGARLRTPLAALRGEIELARRTPGSNPAQQDRFASQMEEIDRLTRLIDQILTLARAESGQIRLTRAPVNLSDLAASLVEQREPIAAAKSIELRCEPSRAVVVDGDAGWLQRLLLNLVDNALKFTRENGRVVVRVTREGAAARIDVQDTGVGLSPADARQAFERFFRADPARSSATAGAGLGLSLVQWIAAQHRGTVTVQSRLAEGSTFTVTLPVGLSRASRMNGN